VNRLAFGKLLEAKVECHLFPETVYIRVCKTINSKPIVDIRLRSGAATGDSLWVYALLTLPLLADYGQTWCHLQDRKYITYCIVVSLSEKDRATATICRSCRYRVITGKDRNGHRRSISAYSAGSTDLSHRSRVVRLRGNHVQRIYYGRPRALGQPLLFFILWFLLCFFFFLFSSLQPSHIGCLPYFHTWCGLSANIECRSEMCCTRLCFRYFYRATLR